MRIAIFQNFLDNIGGAEVVGLTLARELGADIYTTNIDREKVRQMGFGDITIRSIGKVPVNAPFRQQMVLARFRALNLKGRYDFFIINGDWAVSAAVRNKPNMWYVNATIREIWDLYEYTRKNNVRWWGKLAFVVWSTYNRFLNRRHVRHVGSIASNSKYTQERVLKYLGRSSDVVYPPTRTDLFSDKGSGSYWLSVNRLINHKRVDIQMRAFAKMPEERLIVLGPHEKSTHCTEYADYIKEICPPNVTLIEQADSFEELTEFYSRAKGFVTTSYHEDFGMTAVEAMASGKMVIAPNEGGYKESVVHGKTGLLIDGITPQKLIEAIEGTNMILAANPDYFAKSCLDQARKFDVKNFTLRIKKIMEETISI